MTKYDVSGMSCAACSARVEKAVKGVAGVSACNVNLLTNSMTVEGNVDPDTVIAAVKNAGYGANVSGHREKEEQVPDSETPKLVKRLVSSVVLLSLLMYVSMFHTMWGAPLPFSLSDNPVATALIQLLLTIAVMIINGKFFVSGFRGALRLSPNMDTLVALGSGAAFVYSLSVLFKMTYYTAGAHIYLHDMYFESSAMILTLITVGKMLEARSKGKTANALKGLMNLAPKTATVVRDGKEITVPVSDVVKGDIFTVRAGESIPVDGKVIDGNGSVNESALTGESIPVDKKAQDSVYTASISVSGYMKCEALRVGEDTALAKIIQMMSDASASKAPVAKVADKVSGVFVPVVMGISLVTLALWLALGQSVGFALARAISVLVISCPCALGLATPVAIMVGSGVGAKNNILFKTATALENTGKIKTVVLDKTGTVTKGAPSVTDIILYGCDEKYLLERAYALEYKSEHPLARAVCDRAKDMTLLAVTDFKTLTGSGVEAFLDGAHLQGGSVQFINSVCPLPDELIKKCETLSNEGKTPLAFVSNNNPLGVIAVADTVKDDSETAVSMLREMGIRVVMLTGDNVRTANAVASKVGITDVIASVKPDGKADAVKKLRESGSVAMVGDGINDAVALKSADIGIAIGTGADIAVDAADVVLMNSRLTDVANAIKLSRKTLYNIYQNLFFAFIYNIIGIPLACGVLIPLGITLNPMFGALAMSLSSFCVVSNALRLNTVNFKKEEKIKMEKTFKIEGMMCPHCEARVKTVIEGIDGVALAVTSHKDGTAVVTLVRDVDDSVIVKAVTDAGYKVIS